MASYGIKNKMQKDEKEMISRNPTEDGARPGVLSTFDDVLRVNPFYYSSPFKRSKADDVFPRYYRGGSRENFGT